MRYHALYIDRRDGREDEPESAIAETETLDDALAEITAYFLNVPSVVPYCLQAYVRDTLTGEIVAYQTGKHK